MAVTRVASSQTTESSRAGPGAAEAHGFAKTIGYRFAFILAQVGNDHPRAFLTVLGYTGEKG